MSLIMINGPCGAGKSETSRWLQAQIPGSEWVRLDDVRKTIPEDEFIVDGKPDAVARMWETNVVGRNLAKATLDSGNTVIVDAIKYQSEWVEPWEILGKEAATAVLDVCLLPPKPIVEARALTRGYKPSGRLTPEKVSRLYDQVVAFYVDRPHAIIISNEHLSIKETGRQVLDKYLSTLNS